MVPLVRALLYAWHKLNLVKLFNIIHVVILIDIRNLFSPQLIHVCPILVKMMACVLRFAEKATSASVEMDSMAPTVKVSFLLF